MRERFAVQLYAYVLMENHYHLLLHTWSSEADAS